MNAIEKLYQQLDEIKIQKGRVIKSQNFEMAATLRDKEKCLQEEVDNVERSNKLFLSKSKYVKGMNCPKALWLYNYKFNEQQFSDAQQVVFQQGTNVGELAQYLFPNGVLAVKADEYPSFASAKYTQELIEKGVTTIYEATFVFDNIIVAVDILDFKNGEWNVFEVKSSTSIKDVYITDIALQQYVIDNSKVFKKAQYFVIYINNQYVRQGALDMKKLFKANNVTNQTNVCQQEISQHCRNLRVMLMNPEPCVAMGEQCIKPYGCSFYIYCDQQNPIPEIEQTELSHEPIIQKEELLKFKKSIKYSLGFLDFETINPAVPLFDNNRPYQQLVFQYSLHVQHSVNSELQHIELLANTYSDPRLQIIPSLILNTKKLKTIFVYNKTFECSRLNEMIRDFPQYADELNLLNEKLVDLMPVFRYNYRTESMGSKYSIKVVLPILFPEMNYNNLSIGDGMLASQAYLNLYFEKDNEALQETRKHLIEYCTQDTLAMVKLWEKLLEIE